MSIESSLKFEYDAQEKAFALERKRVLADYESAMRDINAREYAARVKFSAKVNEHRAALNDRLANVEAKVADLKSEIYALETHG